jgi:hypothetical protein
MKKFIQILTTAIISTAFIGSFASAASCDGTITVTGPGSNNTITCNDDTNITVSCVNNVTVGNINNQTGSSGSASSGSNTSGGNVATGTVVNDNGNNVTIGASCNTPTGAVVETPGKGSTEVPGGGQGGIGELPNTANTPAVITVIRTALIATGLVFAAHFAYKASRYLIGKSIQK